MKSKLIDHFGGDINIFSNDGIDDLISFSATSFQIRKKNNCTLPKKK
jgi:hypothetical protein